jgi:hypothetical protein
MLGRGAANEHPFLARHIDLRMQHAINDVYGAKKLSSPSFLATINFRKLNKISRDRGMTSCGRLSMGCTPDM